ncbi:hypothetical protein RII69_003970 [Vibrio parahaemolyticus]|nr:hypothetical protein [Vibrio parahaemolyticus]ELC0687688.1 hypothetical protein [Vibrio parahaemolyticus]
MRTKLLVLAALMSASAMGEQSEIDRRTKALVLKGDELAVRDFQESAALMLLLQHQLDAEITNQIKPLVDSGQMTREQSLDATGRIHGVMMHYANSLKWESVLKCHGEESDYYLDQLLGFEVDSYPTCRETVYRYYEERARPALQDNYKSLSQEAKALAHEIVDYMVDISM